MAGFDHLKGVFGLLPTPYRDDYEIDIADLRAAAEFCCGSGQHGIVWPVMVGEFYVLGEQERLRGLDAVLDTVNGRLPVVFGCSGVSIPQVVLFAAAAQKAGADAVIAMAPARTTPPVAMETYHRIADVYDGPIILQNSADYTPLASEQVQQVVEEVPGVQYVKEERPPGPHHIGEVHRFLDGKVKTIFGGVGGRFLPEELTRGANGSMPACQLGDLLAKVIQLWWDGDRTQARALHQRLLPLIVRERHAFMRYMLRRRGVLSSTAERIPSSAHAVDDDEKREISILLDAVRADISHYPFGAE
jgi:dihydrodipicolinate synthase/N-acetylneuraminate lyase